MSKLDNEYSEGIAGDGAAILRNGEPLEIELIVTMLREREDYLNTAIELYKLLDDIDTCDDVFKENQQAYRDKVRQLNAQRHDYFTTDGYSLFDVETQRELIKIGTESKPKYYKEKSVTNIIVEISGSVHSRTYTDELRQPFNLMVLDHDTYMSDSDYEVMGKIDSDKFREIT